MIDHVSLIVHDLGVLVQSVEYHPISVLLLPGNADVLAHMFVVGVVIEHLFLYVLRGPLDLIM
jgi:hypothetical protein